MKQQKFIRGMYALLVCFITLPIFAQTNFSSTFVICPGDSVFLAAQQNFAQGPAPAGGGFGCQPQLINIEISPTANATKEEKRGFTIKPEASAIYEVKSLTLCGLRGPSGPEGINTFQVVVSEACESYILPTYEFVLGDYPWLADKITPSNCGSLPITTFYEQDGFIQVSIATRCYEPESFNTTIYDANGSEICSYSNQVYICEEAEATIQRSNIIWTSTCNCPLKIEPACSTFNGLTLSKNSCIAGCNNLGDVVPCDEISFPPLFEDYPWLKNIINITACTNEQVAVYQSGIYFYLLVTDANGQAILYNQNGQFYCQQSFSFDCVAAYNLGAPIETWRCPTGINEAVIITTAACIGERIEFNYPPLCNGRQIETPTTNDIIQHIGDIGSTNTVIATLKNYGSFERYHLVPHSEGGCDRVLHIYEMIEREDCNMEEPPSEIPYVYDDFPWLREVLTPIDCKTKNGEKIIFFNDDPNRGVSNSTALEMYQSGGFTYFLVQYEPSIHASLFFQDGSLLCTNSIGYDCVEAYRLGNPVASWTCVNPFYFPCTDDISPVCGSDGRTYTNECEARRAGVDVIATGECSNIPPEAPDEIFFDYPWLTDIINPNNCNNERIEVYQSGNYRYVMVRTSGGEGVLYNQDGLFYCQQSANYDCITAYNLTEQIDIWTCITGVACPAVYDPVCGVDGKTYGNDCEAGLAGVEIAYGGVCTIEQPVISDVAQLFIDYAWLGDIVNPTICTTEKVEIFQSGVYFYLLVTDASGQATLYNQDGQFYCQQTANYSCVAAYNLGQAIQTWQCGVNSPQCPAVFVPVCGMDGITYDACQAGKQGIEIAYRGYCDPGPVICDMFTGTVVEKECGLFILVGTQYWDPIFLDGITIPSARDIVEFAFFPRDPNDYPDEGCITSQDGTPPIVGVVSCLNVTSQIDFEETYIICPGESVFLKAKQEREFPFGPGLTCLVSVDGINIFPTTNANKEELTGFTVSPQQTTIYAVESETFCRAMVPVGPARQTRIPPVSIRYYQVVIADNCNQYPDCNTTTSRFRNRGTIVESICNTVVVDLEENNSGLSGLISAIYSPCVTTPIDIVGTQVEIDFEPIPYPESCPPAIAGAAIYVYDVRDVGKPEDCFNERGTVFFENCDDGREFYFIEMNDGRILDPYIDGTINYIPVNGHTVNFGYVDATFNTPCSIAEKAIAITCIEEINTSEIPPSPIFLDYPWLLEIVNPNNCKGERITFYQSGTYQFLFIEVDGIGTLYFQDGTRYCQSTSTYDCVAIYQLGTPVDFWECGQAYKDPATERKHIEITQLEGFVAYPNPTLGTLQVQLPILKNSAELRITNLFGQQLMERVIPANSFTQTMTLDLSDFQNGVYYLHLKTNGQRGIERIIKQDLR